MKKFLQLPISTRLFSLAILLRVLVMPFLFHPDIKTYSFQVSFLQKGVFNIYTYLDQNKDSLPLKEEFAYQPLTYITLGSWQMIIKPLLGSGFDEWLWDASQQAVERVGVFRYLFFLKLPYLFFDVAIAFILMLFFKTRRAKRQVFTLWLFNPFTIFIIYSFGNIDVIPVFLVLLSILQLKKGRCIVSAVLLGIAAGFKAYPLLILPLVVLECKSFKKGLVALGGGLGVFMATLLPYWSKSLLDSAVVSGLTTRIFLPSIDLGFGVKIALPIVAIILVYLFAVGKGIKVEHLVALLLMVLLAFIHYHIQWLLWLLPFIIILFVAKTRTRWLLILLASLMFILPFLFDDKSMSVSLFSLYSYYFTLVPTPFAIVQKFFDIYLLQNIVQSTIVAVSLCTLWKILNYQKS